MMDESPEPTMILRTLKDFNQFISSGSKGRQSTNMTGSSRLRLNFSDAISECSSILEETQDTSNTRKRPLDSLTGLDVSKRFREKETELAEVKSTVTMLEGRLKNVETSNKRTRLVSDNELDTLKRKSSRDKELIDDLQHKIKILQSQQREFQEEARKAKQKCNTSTYEAESKVISMQRESIEQNNRLSEKVSYLQHRVLDLEAELEEKNVEVDNVQCNTDELLNELSTAQEKLRESTSSQLQVETLQLQLDQAKAKIKDLEMQHEEFAELEKKNQVFESTMGKLYILEKENTKLREENKFLKNTTINTKLLEEKIIQSKQKIMLLESRCEDIAHCEARAELYKNNLKMFEDAMMEELNLSLKPTVQELRSHISKLKKEDIQLTTGIEQLYASQKCMENRRTQGENELKNLRTKLDKQCSVTQQNAQIIKRLQRKLLLLTQERDSLKHILSTYEAELTINFSTVSHERIDKMEKQLSSYREELKLMEEELEEAYKSAVQGTSTPKKRDRSERVLSMEKKLTELEEKVKKLKEENTKLTEENASLTEEKEVLEGRIENLTLKGDYDPTSTKVLHFKNNPLATAIENRETQLETLQTENDALRERVRLLEEGEQHDLTQKIGMKISSEGHSSKDVLSLQEQISSIETRNKRLMDLFKKKSQEMREAVYLLTGYRIDITNDNHYKLTNMYAETADDFFMFELADDNELQLLETAFSNTLEDFIDIYLTRKHSLPSFLSAITLDLFRRQSVESPIESPVSGVGEEMDDEEMDEMSEGGQQPQRTHPQRHDMEDEEEEMDEEEEEYDDEEEEEENYGEEEGEGGDEDEDGDDLICLD